MKILYLFSDTISNKDQLITGRFGVCVGNNQLRQFLHVAEEEFYELMAELNKRKLILNQEQVDLNGIKRVRFFLETEN